MAFRLIYPTSNPLQMFIPDYTRDAKYNSKDFIDFDYPETVMPWEQRGKWCQPWQLSDRIPLQLQCNNGPVMFVLKECESDRVIDTIEFDQKQQDANNPGSFIYELNASLSGYEEGCYYGEIYVDDILALTTGDLHFAELHEGTLLAEYSHYEEREDVIYQTGWQGALRIPSYLKYNGAKSKATTYTDQVVNEVALRNQKFREYEWRIGTENGVPDYFADIIGSIFGCSTFNLDGKSYTVPQGTDMEAQEIVGYGMRWWSINPLRDRFTRSSRTFDDDTPQDAQITSMITVDLKGISKNTSGDESLVTDII